MPTAYRRWTVALAVTLAVTTPAIASAGAAPAGGPTVVSGETPLPRPWEANACGSDVEHQDWEQDNYLAVNPTNSANLVAAWQQDWQDAIVVGYSTDHGRSWRTVVPGTTPCTGGITDLGTGQGFSAIDPWLAFGPSPESGARSIAYLTSVVLGKNSDSAAVVNRSLDGGKTWSKPTVLAKRSLQSDGALIDMTNVVADPARPGHAFAAWDELNSALATSTVRISRTDDGGAHWSTPKPIRSSQTSFPRTVGQLLVLPDIDGKPQLVNVFAEIPPQPIRAGTFPILGSSAPVTGPTTIYTTRSTDERDTWSEPVPIATVNSAVASQPGTALAPDGRTIYVVWPKYVDDVSRSSFELIYTKSTDGGLSWSEPVTAGETVQSPLPDLAGGAVSVANDGTVAVLFYDQRNDPPDDAPQITDLWIRLSNDGGRNWAEDHIAGPFDRATAPDGNIGNYQGLAPTGDGLAATFVLARPPAIHGDTDVFFTRFQLG